jgi:1-acyl-sn-glycerol-3-phosphate acyltransferase
VRLAVRFIAHRNLRVQLVGDQHLPKVGPALLIARRAHPFYDSIALLDTLPRLPHLVVGLGWIREPFLRPIATSVCDILEWPAAQRGEHLYDHEISALESGAALLRRGEVLAAYTEGSAATNAEFIPLALLTLLELAQRDGEQRIPIVPAGFRYVREPEGWSVTIRLGAASFLDARSERNALLDDVLGRARALSRDTLDAV